MKILLTVLTILMLVSCSSFNEPRIVDTTPSGCLSKGVLTETAFDSEHDNEYITRLKKKASEVGANTVSCCVVFSWEDPKMEDWVVAINPKTNKSEHVYGVKAEAFSCRGNRL